MNGICGIIIGFSWISTREKPSVQKLWRPICKCVGTRREPFSRSFGTNKTQHLREGQLVGRMLLQRLATGATGVKQARYRRGPTRAQRGTRTRMRSIYTACVVGGVMSK